MSRWHFKKSQLSLAERTESTEEIFKMDTDECQIPSYQLELESSHSSHQLLPDTDAKSSFRTGQLSSPSYQLHLLRLSSDSDDCFEAQTPFSPCSMEFEIFDQIQNMEEGSIKERQTNVRFDSGGAGIGQVMVKMEMEDDKVDEEKSCQDDGEARGPRNNSLNTYSDDNTSAYNQLQIAGQANPEEAYSNKYSRASRRRSNTAVKEDIELQTSTTHQNTVPSDFTIPSTLALRRKLKRQACRDPSRKKSGEQNAQLNCPVPVKSPRKSLVPTTSKNSREKRVSNTPRTAPIQARHFVYPEISRVPRPPTKKTCVGSEKAFRQETPPLKDGQTETSTHRKNGENRKATILSLPKICQPRQRRQLRDQVSTASVESRTVAPQSPPRSPKSHSAGLCMSDGKPSEPDPNAAPSICVIPPTSNLALRRKLKRGMSNPLAAESREKSPKQKGISSQEPRLLSRPTLSPNRLSYTLLQKSPKKSPRKSPRKASILATRKINQLSRPSKSPRGGMAKHSYFVYPDIQRLPRPPPRRIRLGSSGRFMAPQESQRYSSQESSISPAVSPNRLSCPLPQKSPRKSPVSTTGKNKQSTRAAKTPKSVTVKDKLFVYPEIPQGSRPPTRKTRLGSGPTWERKPFLKGNQAVTQEKHGEAPKQMISSCSSLPKIPNVQPTKQVSRKKREKTLLEICNALSAQKRTV